MTVEIGENLGFTIVSTVAVVSICVTIVICNFNRRRNG